MYGVVGGHGWMELSIYGKMGIDLCRISCHLRLR